MFRDLGCFLNASLEKYSESVQSYLVKVPIPQYYSFTLYSTLYSYDILVQNTTSVTDRSTNIIIGQLTTANILKVVNVPVLLVL